MVSERLDHPAISGNSSPATSNYARKFVAKSLELRNLGFNLIQMARCNLVCF
jgi:hypothetical protein